MNRDADTVPAHHATPDVAELRRLRDTEREELHSPTRRLDAYYYSFNETGSVPIDAILSAVAIAGKSCHNTDMWTEDDEWSRWGVGRSLVDVIQCAANEAAAALLDAAAERDALAAKVHAFETDDQKLSIMNGWLVYDVGEHTCGGYGPESNYMHEPGCGYEPVLRLDKLQGWPAAELDALNGQLFDAGYRCGELLAENRALAAKVERVRALHRAVGIYDECDCDAPDPATHLDVDDVGLTCNLMYRVCAECCRDDVYQTEDCANYHDHRLDEDYHCPTIRALDEEPQP